MGLLRGNRGNREENHYGELWRAIPGPSHVWIQDRNGLWERLEVEPQGRLGLEI